jgi:hypothetical protein
MDGNRLFRARRGLVLGRLTLDGRRIGPLRGWDDWGLAWGVLGQADVVGKVLGDGLGGEARWVLGRRGLETVWGAFG